MKKKRYVIIAAVILTVAMTFNTLALSGNLNPGALLQKVGFSLQGNQVNDEPTVFEFQEKGYKNAWDELLAEDGFVYGIDYNYVGTNLNISHSLGSNHLLNMAATWNSEIAYIDIYNIKALGFNCTQYWLLQDGQGVQFDDDGIAVAIDEEFITNLTELLEICREIDIKLLPALVPHGWAENFGAGGVAGTPNEIFQKYFRYMWDKTAQDAFLENVINPVLDVIVKYQDVVPCVALCVENASGIVDDQEAGYYRGSGRGTTWENWANFLNRMHDAVKAKMPNMYTSIEDQGPIQVPTRETQYRMENLKVDFPCQNVYPSSKSVFNRTDALLTRPGYIGEMNTGGKGSDPNLQEYWKDQKCGLHQAAKESGWMGAFLFCYKVGGDPYWLMEGSTVDYETFYAWSINFRYTNTDGINEYRGKERDKVEKSYLFANKGGSDVYWIPGRGAEKFDLQRSLDGGKTWVTVAENIDLYESSIDNGLVKYTDSTVGAGMNYCYRVVSIGEDGTRVTGDANNSKDFFVPKNYLSEADSGFENDGGLGNWKNTNFGGKITDTDSHSGKYSWLMDKSDTTTDKSYGDAYIDVKVDKNTMYKLTFWFKVTEAETYTVAGSEPPHVRVYLPETKTGLVKSYFGGSTTDGWVQATVDFTVGNTDTVRIYIRTGSKNYDPCKTYLDDFELLEMR